MTALLDIALDYIDRGWSPVPIPWKDKGPTLSGWQHLRITADAAPRFFKARKQNIGTLLGPASSDLVDVDLDCAEGLRTASYFLPLTSMFGRASTPAAHWLYYASDFSFDTAVLTFDDPTRSGKDARLVELRVGGEKGAQTVFPGSVHESGEEVRWERGTLAEPVSITGQELEERVCRVAAAALAARYWPAEGRRHNAAQALGGVLRRAGWGTPQVKLFVEAVVRAAGDPEPGDRLRAALDAAAAVDADERAYGIPKLAACLGSEVVDALVEWLGLNALSALNAHPGGAASAPQAEATTPWPDPLDAAAMHGLAGEVVQAIAPHTEADPAAILLQFLCAFGNACGRWSYVQVEGDRHPPQIWPVLVGVTSKARKGTSWGRIRRLFEEAAPEWTRDRIKSGLSSGEGVIWQVRDAIVTRSKDKKTGEYVETETDAGIDDKRLLVIEAEFASPLRHMERAGNTLSSTLRNLWDSGTGASLTKNSLAQYTTGSTVSTIGHVTVDELRRYLTRTEMGNGFANRCLFACVRRSKELPFGGADLDLMVLAGRLKAILAKLYGERRIGWAEDACRIWVEVYHDLSEGRPGLVGCVTSRAEAQTLRIALIYALLDEAECIEAEHLRAALAVWKYCQQSAAFIFGTATGDPLADEVHHLLKLSPDGMTRSQIYDALGRHRSRDQIGRALGLLLTAGLARSETNPTGGRPEERWYAE